MNHKLLIMIFQVLNQTKPNTVPTTTTVAAAQHNHDVHMSIVKLWILRGLFSLELTRIVHTQSEE